MWFRRKKKSINTDHMFEKETEELIKNSMPKEFYEAAEHAGSHRDEINASKLCGCYYCESIFKPGEITEWITPPGGTAFAMCPHCGIDAVIGDKSGYPVADKSFLAEMHTYWFENNVLDNPKLTRLIRSIEKEIAAFVTTLGAELLTKILHAEDTIDFTVKHEKQRLLVEIAPIQKEGSIWCLKIRYLAQSRRFLSFEPPKYLSSNKVDINVSPMKPKDRVDIQERINDALSHFNQDTLKSILEAKEPLTFSYDDKQVEVGFYSKNAQIKYYIDID